MPRRFWRWRNCLSSLRKIVSQRRMAATVHRSKRRDDATMSQDLPKWETVSLESNRSTTERLYVRGGALYRTILYKPDGPPFNQAVAMIFVPGMVPPDTQA